MHIWAMILKEWRLLFRDLGQVIVLFLMPIMFITVMGAALKDVLTVDTGQTPLPILNLDQGEYGEKLVKLLQHNGTLDVTLIDRSTTAETVQSRIVARELAYALVIPEEFSAAIKSGDTSNVTVLADPGAPPQRILPVRNAAEGLVQRIEVEATLQEEVNLLVDRVVVKAVDAALTEAVSEMRARVKAELLPQLPEQMAAGVGQQLDSMQVDTTKAASQGRETGRESLTVAEPRGRVEVAFPAGQSIRKAPDTYQTNVPGYTVTFMFFIAASIATSVVTERDAGILRRVMSAPVGKASILISKLVPFFLINLLQAALMFTLARFVFGMSLGDSPGALVAISAALALVATGVGLILAGITRSQGQVNGVVPLVSLTLAALGGCLVPLQLMPETMRTISKITPHGWALQAYTDVLVRGHGLEQVWPSIAVLVGFGLVAIISAGKFFRTT